MSTESLYLFCSIAFPILCSVISVFTIVLFWKQERTEEEKILKEDTLKKKEDFSKVCSIVYTVEQSGVKWRINIKEILCF